VEGFLVHHRPPPPIVLQVPLDGFFEGFLESVPGLPAQLPSYLRRVEAVPYVVAGPVFYEGYQLLWFVEGFENPVDYYYG
jgi:hypothetical protein